jgi:hypothetical protein
VACLVVTQLAAGLAGMRFPLDVSGGVARFRHRRGELQRLEVEVGARRIERWAAPRLRGVLGMRSPDVWIGVARSRATVCVAATSGPEESWASPPPAVAFDLHALVEGENLVLVVANARGVGLAATATAIAIACVEAALGDSARREGATFVFRRPAAVLARALFPEAGARTPRADDVRWTAIATAGDTWVLQAVHGSVAAAPDEEAVIARQVAADLRAADDKLVTGSLDEARDACIDLLARSPGQPEIARRLIEIDASVVGRAEAALATLAAVRSRGRDAAADRAPRFGPLPVCSSSRPAMSMRRSPASNTPQTTSPPRPLQPVPSNSPRAPAAISTTPYARSIAPSLAGRGAPPPAGCDSKGA